jgi:DNA polymerase III subunit alpha
MPLLMKQIKLINKIIKFRKDTVDIDVDFESQYRDVVKEYISQRFGEFHTCSIGAYTRFQPRGCVKDLGSVKGLKFAYLNYVTNEIPNKATSYSFRDFVEYAAKGKELKEFFQNNPEIIFVAKYLIDQPKAESIHASAVLILPKELNGKSVDLFNWLPIRIMEGKYVSEYEGEFTDASGFLKEDILGLSQLDKFKHILTLIKQNHNKDIELNKIDFSDKQTYKLFQKGYNEDVFQFNSGGLKSYSQKVKPDCFEDLVAMNALYRPATMEVNAHLDFALMKHGKKEVHYDYGLEEVTKNTYGLMIYQETMMQAVITLGNLTPVESDLMRTATKKFSHETMSKFQEKFLSGAKQNGCPDDEALKIWNKIISFSGYTFNKSHACAYAMIAFQSQWLKAHYPLEFWTVAIQHCQEEEVPPMISEMNKLQQGITIKPPSINKSETDFRCDVETKSIYWSIAKIKGLGAKTVQNIIDARGKKLFEDYADFVARVPKAKVNKGHIEKLILAGAFDEIEEIQQPRQRINLLKRHAERVKYELDAKFKSPEVAKNYFWVMLQKGLTGLGDIDYRQLIQQNEKLKKHSKLLALPEAFATKKDYDEVLICGIVAEIIERHTKKGDHFLILSLVCNNEPIKVLVWSDTVSEHVDFLEKCEGKVIAVNGKVRFDTYNQCNALHCTEDTKFYFL